MVTNSAAQADPSMLSSSAGSSDVRIASLFSQICESLRKARSSSDLSTLRKRLSDINFELTKFGQIALRADDWKPRLSKLGTEVLVSVQVHPIFSLEIHDIENDLAFMLESLMDSFVAENGEKDLNFSLPWYLDFAGICAKTPSLPRIRAFGYTKISSLRKGLSITPENVSLFLPVIVFLVDGLVEDESLVASSAEKSILDLVKHFHITNILHPGFQFAVRIMEIIDKPTNAGRRDIVKFRVFDFIEKLLSEDMGNLADILQLGIMENLYASFRTMDLLVLANNCETICQLASRSAGLQLLEDSGGMRLAEDLVLSRKDSPDFENFSAYVLRIYILLAMKYPEYCILKCANVTLIMPDLIIHKQGYSGAAALEYLGQLASSSVAGKRYLHNLRLPNGAPFMEEVMKFVGKTVSADTLNKGTPINEGCVRCLTLLFRRTEVADPTSDAELQEISHLWFRMLGADLFPAVFKITQNPFKDVKLPVFLLLKEMAHHRWGVEVFRNQPGFIEYILNRQIEVDADLKQLKFDLILAIATNGASKDVLDSVTIIRLKEYVKDGPFYLQGQHQVAFEGGA